MEVRTKKGNDGVIVEIEGELDLATSGAVRDAILGALEDGSKVAADMTRCSFIDSTGLRILVEAARRLQREGDRLELIGLRDQPLKLFELALGGRWEMFKVTEAAPEAE